MNIQFKKGVLDLCVLSLLSKRDCYGYELVTEISKSIEISEGTIYPLLRKLKKEGYVTTYLKESREGPPRKYYKLTKIGIKVKTDLFSRMEVLCRGCKYIFRAKGEMMNQEQYLEKLENLLNGLPLTERKEILYDYEEYFRNAIAEGRDEEDIINSLGEPEALASELIDDCNIIKEAKNTTNDNHKINEFNIDQMLEHCINGVKNINISGHPSKINIHTEDSSNIRVHFHGRIIINTIEPPILELNKTAGDLDFKINYRNSSSKINKDSTHLDIYLPESYVEKLNIKSTSSIIKANSLDILSLKIYLTSGEIRIDNLICKERVRLNTASGLIAIGKIQSKKVKFNSVSGNISVATIEAEKIKITSMSGKLSVETINSHDLKINTASGCIDLSEIHVDKTFELETVSGKSSIGGLVGASNIKSVSGNISLKLTKVISDIKVYSVSGAVKVTLPKESDCNFDTVTLSGKVRTDFPEKTNQSSKKNNSDAVTSNESSNIKVKTVSGNINIHY